MTAAPSKRRFAIAITGLLVVAACSSTADVGAERADTSTGNLADVAGGADGQPGDSAESDEAPDPGGVEPSAADGDGSLDWRPCRGGVSMQALDCATLEVPLDYDDPDGEQIEIAVARLVATSPDRIGSLLFNPGGPGASGIELLTQVQFIMSDELADRFDFVSFDPRGVGASTAIDCDLLLDDDVDLVGAGDRDAWNELVDDVDAYFADCAAGLELAPHLGTVNAARDMDRLREALGDEQLSYVGYSYGTRLGATYAELFPDRVRAFILDGAVKPVTDYSETAEQDAQGFDRAYGNLIAACDDDIDCPLAELGPAGDVIDQLRADVAVSGPLPTGFDGRELTAGELDLAILAGLYSKETWPFLMDGVRDAVNGDGSLLQVIADRQVGRELDGSYTNLSEALVAINCADDTSRPTVDEAWEEADSSATFTEHFEDLFRAGTGCLDWPESDEPLVLGPAVGAAPILVIGSTGDPATPYEWAVEMADFLDSGVLFTAEAQGHTAYGSIECVGPIGDRYLIDLELPDGDARCSDDETADFFPPAGTGQVDILIALFDCLRDNGVDIPEFGPADVLADPSGETLVEFLDPNDEAFIEASTACLSELTAVVEAGG